MNLNIEKSKRSLEEIDQIAKKIEHSEEYQKEALTEQQNLKEAVEKVENGKQLNPMAGIQDLQRLHGPLSFLAVVLLVIGTPVQYMLSGVAFPSLWWVWLVIIAVLVDVGIAAIVELSAFSLFFDVDRSRRTVRQTLTCAGLTGVVAAGAGTVLLFSRTATGDSVAFLTQAVPISFWLLGELLPCTAGFLGVAVWTLGYPGRRDQKIIGIKNRLSELDRFLEWLDREGQKIAGRVLVLLMVCLFVGANSLTWGAVAPPAHMPSAIVSKRTNWAPVRAGEKRCLVFVDMTTSVDPEYRRNAISRFTATVSQFITAFGCSILGIGTFADEGPFTSVTEFQVELQPQTFDCSKATYRAKGTQKLAQNISGFESYYRKHAEEACEAEARNRVESFNQSIAEIAAKMGTAFNPDLPARGQCTAIYGLLSWALKRGSTVSLISDGIETCEHRPSPVELPEQKRLIIVLLPTRNSMRNPGRSAFRLTEEWQRQIRGTQVVMPADVTPDLWSELASRTR